MRNIIQSTVVAVIVTFNGEEWLNQCLTSLKNSNRSVKIVLVDNASSDSSVKIARSFSNIKIVTLRKNIGFGSANNIGIHYALKLGADYVLLLNQDAWVAPDMLTQLLDVMENRPKLGIASPLHWQSHDKYLDPNFQIYLCQGVNENLVDFIRNDLQPLYLVPFVNAAIWLISQNCVQQIGGFDPVFFMYAEDDDYCQRTISHGLEIGIVPAAHAYHARAKSARVLTKWQMLNTRAERMKSVFVLDLKNSKRSFMRVLLHEAYKVVSSILLLLFRRNRDEIFAQCLAFIKVVPLLHTIYKHRQAGNFIPIDQNVVQSLRKLEVL